jgi:two-component system phosphate regulon sensor histidine kinase PhoR
MVLDWVILCKKVVQQHNWKISVENNNDKGITITLFLPF